MIATFTFEYNGAIECKRRSASRYNVSFILTPFILQRIASLMFKESVLVKEHY